MKKNLLAVAPLGKKLDLASIQLFFEKAETCPLQDPYRVRARYIGWKAASLLIDEKGELDRFFLQEMLSDLTSAPFEIALGRDGDAEIYRHLQISLDRLFSDESIWKAIRKCSMPLCSKTAEELIRDTLWPETIQTLHTAHVRRAALTAYLTPLRQVTGSCFATAPAIWVQNQQPLLLLQDLEVILSAGQLKRGLFSVPMNPGAGSGELNKPFDRLNPGGSPGLMAGFHEAKIPYIESVYRPTDTPQSIFTAAFLKHFGLVPDDLAATHTSAEVHAGVMWERLGGHIGSESLKTKQIKDFNHAIDRARRVFCAVADCALLRCWEYTIASFSDVKAEIGRWNLFVSLGLHPEQPSGIGRFFQQKLQEKLDAINGILSQLHAEHQMAANHVRMTENLMRSAASESRRHQLQAEMISAVQAVNSLAVHFDEMRGQAKWLAQFFSAFLEKAIEQLPMAFQEVFDPALVDGPTERFEDSPAGFRLIFKHGRSAAASWERIETEGQFVEAVYRFFESIEREWPIEKEMMGVFTELMTHLLQYIRSEPFLEGAKQRAKDNRVTQKGTPWAYQSGGTMETLVQSYFDVAPSEFSRAIRSEEELLQFLLDGAEIALGKEPLLMRSPTHAFLFYPSWLKKKEVRIEVEKSVTDDQAEFLADQFASFFSEAQRPLFYFGFRQQPHILNLRQRFRLGAQAMGLSPSIADRFLFESLPLFSSDEAKSALDATFQELGIAISWSIEPGAPLVTLRHLFEIAKQSLVMNGAGPFAKRDFEQELAETMRKLGLIPPAPVLFGDTNWSDWLLGFVPDAESRKLQLWRLNRTGLRGAPMEWDSVFQTGGTWSILMN
ncbi:MAG: hypothetical protein HW387_623 [Parachlamydiales bacterium]|nr:hypothetical protein [Parachlamydiales bacterium]